MKKLVLFGLLVCAAATASAANLTWQASPADGLWSNASNWGGTAITGNDTLNFGLSSVTMLTNDSANDYVYTLNFNAGASAYTINGANRFRLTGLTNNSGAKQTINSNVLISSDVNFNGNGNVALNGVTTYTGGAFRNFITGGTLTISNLAMNAQFILGINSEKGAINTAGSSKDSATVIGNISGAFNFYNGSLGKVYLTGTNTYTGQTILNPNSYTELIYENGDGLDKKFSASTGNFVVHSGTIMFNGGNTRETIQGNLQLGRNASHGFGQVTIDRKSGSSNMYFSGSTATIARNHNILLSIGEDNLVGAANANFFGNGFGSTSGTGAVASWITINGRDWATRDNGTGMLRALTGTGAGGYNVDFGSWHNKGIDAVARASNALLTGNADIIGLTQINNLKITTAGTAAKLTIAAGQTLALFGGGLMFVGDHNYEVAGGTLKADPVNGYELNVWQSGAGVLTISSNIDEISNFNKTGAGTLILSGSNNFRVNGMIGLFSGTVKLGSNHALYAPESALGIQTGVLDLNGYNVTVKQLVGQTDFNYTITNSDGLNQSDLTIGLKNGNLTGSFSNYYGLGGGTLLTGNLRVVLQGSTDTPIAFTTANAHTGGFYIMGNTNGARVGGGVYRFQFTSAFGSGAVELGDGGGFAVFGDHNATHGWNNFSNQVIISGSNAFIFGEWKTVTVTGKWTGTGDVEFRNSHNGVGTCNNAFTLNNDMSEFSGTIKLSAAVAVQPANINAKASVNFITGSALNSEKTTYTLWRPTDGGLIGSSTLNTTLQVRGVGNYNVYLGDLTSANDYNSDARMNAGIAGEMSQGAVSSAAGTANLVVGSANHAYSEFAERIMDSGYLEHTGAVVGVAAGAKVAVTKVGTGTWALTGNNTYTGATTVSGGVLLVSGTGSIAGSTSVVALDGGKLDYRSGAAMNAGAIVEARNGGNFAYNGGAPLDIIGLKIENGGILSGTGRINSPIMLNDGVLAPGNSIGIMDLGGDQGALWSDFTYDWEVDSLMVGTAGVNWDLVSIDGSLALGAANSYKLNVLEYGGFAFTAGDAPQEYVVLTTTGGITGFDAGNWDISGNGVFELKLVGNTDLVLSYEAIPEPSTWALLLGGAALLAVLRRCRK